MHLVNSESIDFSGCIKSCTRLKPTHFSSIHSLRTLGSALKRWRLHHCLIRTWKIIFIENAAKISHKLCINIKRIFRIYFIVKYKGNCLINILIELLKKICIFLECCHRPAMIWVNRCHVPLVVYNLTSMILIHVRFISAGYFCLHFFNFYFSLKFMYFWNI